MQLNILPPAKLLPLERKTAAQHSSDPVTHMSSSNRTYNDLFLILQHTIVKRQAPPRPSERMTPYRSLQLSCPFCCSLSNGVDRLSKRTIGSYSSHNVQLPLVKLFVFLRSIARPSLRPENHRLFLIPQRTMATRQAVPPPTQHTQTIS
jgi:hypothetical protein